MKQPVDDPFQGNYPRARRVPWWAPVAWLRCGVTDMLRAPAASLSYGAILAAMGWLLQSRIADGALALALLTGFLLVGPLLATGLYSISLSLERTGTAQFVRSLTAWRVNLTSFSFFGAVLALLLAVWVRVSLVVVALYFDGPLPQSASLLGDVLAAPDGVWFVVAYAATGFGFAALVFSVSVVSLPMLLDRPRCDTMTAIITSLRVLQANRPALLVWAGMIVILCALGIAAWYIGLVLLLPALGHATWHAYRDLVEPVEDAVRERQR